MDIQEYFSTGNYLQLIMSEHEAHILKGIILEDEKYNGRTKKKLLFNLNLILDDWKIERDLQKKWREEEIAEAKE